MGWFSSCAHKWTLDGKTFYQGIAFSPGNMSGSAAVIRDILNDAARLATPATYFVYRCTVCGKINQVCVPGREVAPEPLAMRQAREIAGS